MKLPVRNRTTTDLTLFVEPSCVQFEIPPQGEAIVTLADGASPALDFHPENWVTLWSDGETEAVVEVISKEQAAVPDALDFATVWLCRYGTQGRAAAEALAGVIDRGEGTLGYLQARFAAYEAFRKGFRAKAAEARPQSADLPLWTGREALQGGYGAGGVAAYWNDRIRLEPGLIETGSAPFDSDLARRTFGDADSMIGHDATAGAVSASRPSRSARSRRRTRPRLPRQSGPD